MVWQWRVPPRLVDLMRLRLGDPTRLCDGGSTRGVALRRIWAPREKQRRRPGHDAVDEIGRDGSKEMRATLDQGRHEGAGAAPQRCVLAYDGMWHIMVCQGQQHDIHTHILKLYAIILVGEHRHGQVPRTVRSEGPR